MLDSTPDLFVNDKVPLILIILTQIQYCNTQYTHNVTLSIIYVKLTVSFFINTGGQYAEVSRALRKLIINT